MRVLVAVLLLFAASLTAATGAGTYPSRAIRVVVPFPPGGGTDVLARIIGQKLNERWGQPVVIENQGGASGSVGSRTVARAEPDGYTLLMASTGALMAMSAGTGGDGPFDVDRYFSPVTLVAAPPYLVTVRKDLPADTAGDLARLARENPGKLTFGSSGVGAASHLAGQLFQKLAGVSMLHVPYRGTGQAVTDLISGRLDVMFAPAPTVEPLVQAKEVRALATTAADRSALFPSLPTVGESGVPGYEAVGWFGLLAPARTPPDLVHRLNAELTAIMALPDVRERLAAIGAEPQAQTPEQFGRFINADVAKWSALLKAGDEKPPSRETGP